MLPQNDDDAVEDLEDLLPDDDYCECGGDGWVTADCFEDTCCCIDPETQHGVEPCQVCNPKGKK